MAFRARKTDNITAAVLFRLISRERLTLLFDEADNADLLRNPTMRAVINAGHHCEGTVARYLDERVEDFVVFGPIALAAIGMLPLPVLHRSVVIHMKRAPANANLVRFDPKTIARQRDDCETVYRQTFDWMSKLRFD